MVVLTLARPFQIWRHGNFRTNNFFGGTECFYAVNATLVYGCFNVGKTILDLGTTHPLPWVGCEKNLETLELVVLMLLMLCKAVLTTVHKHQPTNKKFSFANCLKKLMDLTL